MRKLNIYLRDAQSIYSTSLMSVSCDSSGGKVPVQCVQLDFRHITSAFGRCLPSIYSFVKGEVNPKIALSIRIMQRMGSSSVSRVKMSLSVKIRERNSPFAMKLAHCFLSLKSEKLPNNTFFQNPIDSHHTFHLFGLRYTTGIRRFLPHIIRGCSSRSTTVMFAVYTTCLFELLE